MKANNQIYFSHRWHSKGLWDVLTTNNNKAAVHMVGQSTNHITMAESLTLLKNLM